MQNNKSETLGEQFVRRTAENCGLMLRKERCGDDPGYMLVDAAGYYVAVGGEALAFSLTLAEAAAWLAYYHEKLVTAA